MAERSVLIIQNIPREKPGIIQEVLDKNGILSTVVDLSTNQKIPPIDNFGAVVVMGGPDSANDETPKMHRELSSIREALDSQVPYLGICLGMQTLVKAAGGEVVKSPTREIGFIGPDGKPFQVTLTEAGRKDALFSGLGDKLPVFHLHGETVVPTANVQLLASGEFVENQIVKVGENAYGIQSHFELTGEMLDKWIKEDPDLQALNARELRQEFARIRNQYNLTAWTLFKNFLQVAGLAD